jgi:hypothetical protein
MTGGCRIENCHTKGSETPTAICQHFVTNCMRLGSACEAM